MLQALKNILSHRLQEQGIAVQVEATQVVEAVKQEVVKRFGAATANAFRKVALRDDNTLEILLTSPALASELKMVEYDIVNLLQARFGKQYRLRIFG